MWPIVLQTIEWGAKPQRNTKFMHRSYNGLLYLTLNQKDPGSNPGRCTKQYQYRLRVGRWPLKSQIGLQLSVLIHF